MGQFRYYTKLMIYHLLSLYFFVGEHEIVDVFDPCYVVGLASILQ